MSGINKFLCKHRGHFDSDLRMSRFNYQDMPLPKQFPCVIVYKEIDPDPRPSYFEFRYVYLDDFNHQS